MLKKKRYKKEEKEKMNKKEISIIKKKALDAFNNVEAVFEKPKEVVLAELMEAGVNTLNQLVNDSKDQEVDGESRDSQES